MLINKENFLVNSPHRRELQRIVRRALQCSGRSPLSLTVRRLADHLQRHAAKQLPHPELVEQIVAWIVQHRSESGASARPTMLWEETWREPAAA
jgi:hypothetical protein